MAVEAEVNETRQFLKAVRELSIPPIRVIAQATTPKDPWRMMAASLVCSVAELHIASLAVLGADAPAHAKTLVRSMLDAQANLYALLKNPNYLKKLELDAARNLVDVYGGLMADQDTRPMMGDVDRDPVRKARIQYKKLLAAGIASDTGEERFKAAGLEETYTVYQQMCASTHNDLNALTQRHVRDDGRLVYFDTMPRGEIRSVCGIQLATLAASISRLPDFTDLDSKVISESMAGVPAAFASAEAAYCEPIVLPEAV